MAEVRAISSRIEQEQWDVRRPKALPQISTHSTLEPAALPNFIGCFQKTEALNRKAIDLFGQESHRLMGEMEKVREDQEQTLREQAEETKARTTWGTLAVVAQYIAGAGSAVLGAACGGIPGAMLIAAGVIGLGERALKDSNLLNVGTAWLTESKELQKKIANNIETGAFYLQMGLSVAGGIGAWRAGTHIAAQKTVASTLTGASSALALTSRVGTSYHDKKLSHLYARSKDLDTRAFNANQQLSDETQLVTKMIESGQADSDRIKNAIHYSEVHLD
jgi:hypothetical protein